MQKLMPHWLPGIFVSTRMRWVFALASGLTAGGHPSPTSSAAIDFASRSAFPLILASWVMADARKRGRRLCYDYDSFVFFAWALVVPVYLFQTRGIRAFLTLLWFAGICLIAASGALIHG